MSIVKTWNRNLTLRCALTLLMLLGVFVCFWPSTWVLSTRLIIAGGLLFGGNLLWVLWINRSNKVSLLASAFFGITLIVNVVRKIWVG